MRAWIALILFSQTTWAGQIANRISVWLFGGGPVSVGSPPFLMQKGYHVLLFGGLGWLLARSAAPRPAGRSLALAVGISVVAEALQMLAPGRSPQVSDALLNVAAATLAWAVAKRMPRSRSAAPTS